MFLTYQIHVSMTHVHALGASLPGGAKIVNCLTSEWHYRRDNWIKKFRKVFHEGMMNMHGNNHGKELHTLPMFKNVMLDAPNS